MEKRETTTGKHHKVISRQRMTALLSSLIDIYSPSGKEEDILQFLSAYLEKHRIPFNRQHLDDSRYNIVAAPADTDILCAFIGHIDTIPAYDFDHYGYERDGDTVMGLGSADMKGGCAALIEAYCAIYGESATPPPVALVIVVGEEENGDGAEALVKDYHFPWALIAEPTHLVPCLSHYGYLEIQILSEGKRKHASLSKSGQNPIDAILRLLLAFSSYIETSRPTLVYNIRDLYSPQAGYVVPEWCEAWVDMHIPPDGPIGEITYELEEMIEHHRTLYPDLEISLRLSTIQNGYDIPDKGPMIETLHRVFTDHDRPWSPQPFRSHSDANTLWESGIKPIILGPGHLEQAHATEEYVSFADIMRAAEIYYDFMAHLSTD